MPVSFSALLPNRIRRDEVRARRQGTGRVTTKRTFSLNVFKGAQLGQFGRRTGLPLKQGVKRDAYGLDDVDNFWRDSLEGAPSDQQAEGAADGEPPAPISHEAPAEAPVAEAVAEPENPFGRANKLMRTPGGARPPMVRCPPPSPPRVATRASAPHNLWRMHGGHLNPPRIHRRSRRRRRRARRPVRSHRRSWQWRRRRRRLRRPTRRRR